MKRQIFIIRITLQYIELNNFFPVDNLTGIFVHICAILCTIPENDKIFRVKFIMTFYVKRVIIYSQVKFM